MSSSSSIVSWKGKTLQEIVTLYKKNDGSLSTDDASFFRARPSKIYRRERVGGVVPNQPQYRRARLLETQIQASPMIRTELDTTLLNNPPSCFNTAQQSIQFADEASTCNALRRVRGNIRRKTVNDTFADNQQRIHNRQKSYAQNLPNSTSNLVCPDGSRQYPIYHPNNSAFAVQGAVDSSSMTLKRKLDAFTRTANANKDELLFQNGLGNYIAHGVQYVGYTAKEKQAYPYAYTNCTTKQILKDAAEAST